MADVIFVAILFGFFGIAWLFVLACDRIIGPGLAAVEGDGAETDSTKLEKAA